MNAFMCPACGETTEAIGARLCIVCGAKVPYPRASALSGKPLTLALPAPEKPTGS
jgi:tRNA(Ile2) C34 agmatinyltransferase TiaS